MTETLWNPWEVQYNELFEGWLRAALLSGVIGDEQKLFNYEDLLPIVDNAEALDLLGDMSRDKAILLIGLWMGRYQGNKDTGEWVEKPDRGDTELEHATDAAEYFLDQAKEGTGKEFWAAVARLKTAIEWLHPENKT